MNGDGQGVVAVAEAQGEIENHFDLVASRDGLGLEAQVEGIGPEDLIAQAVPDENADRVILQILDHEEAAVDARRLAGGEGQRVFPRPVPHLDLRDLDLPVSRPGANSLLLDRTLIDRCLLFPLRDQRSVVVEYGLGRTLANEHALIE